MSEQERLTKLYQRGLLTEAEYGTALGEPEQASNAHTGALIDVRYALRQLREFRCIDRAIDALERVEETLQS